MQEPASDRVDEKLYKNRHLVDADRPHISVTPQEDPSQVLLTLLRLCPAGSYSLNGEGQVEITTDGCLEWIGDAFHREHWPRSRRPSHTIARPPSPDVPVSRSDLVAIFKFSAPAFAAEVLQFESNPVIAEHGGAPGFARAFKADGVTPVADFSAGPGNREIEIPEIIAAAGHPVTGLRAQARTSCRIAHFCNPASLPVRHLSVTTFRDKQCRSTFPWCLSITPSFAASSGRLSTRAAVAAPPALCR